MTTLDTLIEQRLGEFDAKIAVALDPDEKKDLEDKKIEYLLKTAPFIKEYVDDEEQTTTAGSASSTLPLFEKRKSAAATHTLDSYVNVTNVSRRSQIFHRYLVDVEENPNVVLVESEPESQHYICDRCGGTKILDARESSLVCSGCGTAHSHMEMSTRNLTYSEEVNQVTNSVYSYKKINHMIEWLSSLQGKENCEIPEEVVEAVKNEFKKQRLNKKGDITSSKVRAFLKKLNLNKYYEHTNLIVNLINGVPPPKMPASLEEQLKQMFLMIQAPFAKHCPPTRSNFLSYAFCLHKMCQLLGHDEYLPHFPLLKSTQKLYAQDVIWKKICTELEWEFIPSI